MIRDELVAEALSWRGTPYHPHARLKGIGVDCANLLLAVYERAGALPHIDPGHYPTGWHLHRNEELFLDWIARVGGREIERAEARPGDIAVWRFGRTYSHGGMLVDDAGLVVHAYLDSGVRQNRLDEEPLASRPVRFFRLLPAEEV